MKFLDFKIFKENLWKIKNWQVKDEEGGLEDPSD